MTGPTALTAAQLAARWQVHADTIRRKCASGDLPTLPFPPDFMAAQIRALED
jgi:hypothetical protein